MTAAQGSAEGGSRHLLASDLARLCLPAAYKDSNRNLAWANSICFLFLLIGLIGLKNQRVVQRSLTPVSEPVPVVFTPPEEKPAAQPDVKPDEPQPQDAPVETPQVAQVVAVADSPAVAFAVPVQGAVSIASEARYATPPAPVVQAAPKATKFDPNTAGGGGFPPPQYPSLAVRNRYQGTATIQIFVEPSGEITSVKLFKTSGFPLLDDAALRVVKEKWRFPPGEARNLLWDCTFELK